MDTSRRQLGQFANTVGVCAVVLGMVLGLLPGVGGVPAARADDVVVDFKDFEIDGDLSDADGDGDDWTHYGDAENTPSDGVGNQDTSWFEASTKEQDYGTWEFIAGGNAPKADLIRSWIQTQLAPDEEAGDENSWVALATTRASDNGNAQVTVEFNQQQLTDYTGYFRTDGDFYLRFNFPGNSSKVDTSDPQAVVDAIDARFAVWQGSATEGAFGPEQELNTGTDPAVRAAISSINPDDPDGLTFIELVINLKDDAFGDLLGGGCTAFGAAGFRTEATGGNDNNDNTTLKDVIQPFPIDLNTCSPVTVEKVDAEGGSLVGAEFTVYTDEARTVPVTPVDGTTWNTCTTSATEPCSFGSLEPGTYYIDETIVPDGYRPDPALDELADYPDGYRFTVGAQSAVELSFTDPRIPYTIDVAPDGRNAVGNTHEFTVSLDDDLGAVAGADIDLTWTGVGSITSTSPSGPDASSCTTDVDGECSVVVQSDDAGAGTLSATFATPYQNTTGAAPGDTTVDGDGTVAYSSISDSAAKTWVGYVADIEATATNLRGDPHTFTATVWEVDGDGTPDEVLAEDVTVTVTWSGPTGSTIDSTTCVTGADGECDFTVDSTVDGGTGTITIVELDGVIAGIDGQADEALTDTTPTAVTDGSLTAQKTWRIYRASIDDDSVNPAGQKHTFTVTVEYSDDDGATWSNPGAGITVGWDGPTPDGQSVLADSTCDDGTDSSGSCTIVVMSNSPGTGTVTVTGVAGDLVPGGTTTESFTVPSVEATKTWLSFTVDVDGPFINLVGEPETFTVTVKTSDDGTDYVPVTDGTVVSWTDSTSGLVSGDTCTSPGTVNGECEITVVSSATGTFDITVTGIEGYADFDTPQDITFTTSAETSKTWVDYRAFIEADGVNLVGDEHTFTVTAQVDDGTGWKAVQDGTVVTVTSSGLAATVDQSDCADGTSGGTCDVVVDADVPGTVTITVDTVSNETAVDSPVASVDVDGGERLDAAQSVSADKTWIAYRAAIEESATNLTGQQHVFSVTAEQDDGSGWTAVPDGTAVGYSTTDDSTVQSDTCDGTVAGACTITVDSSAVASVTVTIDTVGAEDVDGTPDADVSDSQASATKDWIAVRLDVEADEFNVVGEPHTFTIDVTLVTPGGEVDAPDGTTVALSTSGAVGQVDTQTCDTPGTSSGQCTVTVSSTSPGDLVLSADSVSFTYDGTAFLVDFGDEVVDGEASGQDRTATKTWRDYRVSIEAHDLNRVRESHTFSATIEQTDDGDTWAAVPDGTTATVLLTGGTGSGDAAASTCASTGTVEGSCDVVVDATSAGTLTATVTEISVDLPEEQRTAITVDVADDSAEKTWAAFRASISADSVNVTGDSHDFAVSGEYTVDGSDWLPLPDGSSITWSDSGVGSTSSDTCDSTVAGDCTVTVVSSTSGDRVVTVTGMDPAAIAISGPDGDIVRDFGPVTLADEAVGIAPNTDTDVSATKTWASYTLSLDPAQATNLLSGQEGDTERYHAITATLRSDDADNAPVAGQTIDVTISGDGTIDSVEDGTVAADGLSASCVTADDGTCEIVIFSATPGQATLSGSYQATVGDSAPVTVDGNDAVKTWTTFRVTVTPEQAVNLVGNAHVFTVTVEQSSPAADCDTDWCAVAGAAPVIDVTGTDLTVDTSDCDAGTDSSGECTVTVTSSTVQSVTLTATHTEAYDDYDSEVQGQSTVGFSDSGDKTWIDHAIDVDPDDDENLVGTDHVFTVTVTTTFPTEGGTTTEPVVGANPTLELTGPGSITATTCDAPTGTDADGQCTVTISSPVPGSSTLTATYLGTAADDDEVREYTDSGDKLWVDYALVLGDDATNVVGDPHTFTAMLTIDTGKGFGPAVGEELTFSVEGVGAATGGDVDLTDLTCATDLDGLCVIVIDSDDAGTTTVAVSHGAVVGDTSAKFTDEAVKQWIDIELVKTAVTGDGFADGDLIADPTAFPFLFFSTDDTGPKTAVYEYTITNPSNVTLLDVALLDDRLGTIDLSSFPDCEVLDPGETCTARSSEQFDYDDATARFGAPITNVGVVTATGDGEQVTDADDATIGLVAVQSSILIDLSKEVVAGDDVAIVDGRPTVNWSQEEYEAGTAKTVTYRFTVTNISNATIVDVELIDPMLSDQPIIATADGITLAPDESTTVEVDHTLTVGEAFPDGPIASRIDNVASVSGANETRDSFSEDVDDASVFIEIVFAELPATGFDRSGLLPVSMLLMSLGIAVLWLDRRRQTTG